MSIESDVFDNLKKQYDNPDFIEQQKQLANTVGDPDDEAVNAVIEALNAQVARIDGINNLQNQQFQLVINRLAKINDQIITLANGTGISVPSIDDSPLTVDGSDYADPGSTVTPIPPAPSLPSAPTDGPSGIWSYTKENVETVTNIVVAKVEKNELAPDTSRTDAYGTVINLTIGYVQYYMTNGVFEANHHSTFQRIDEDYTAYLISRKVIQQLKDNGWFDNKRFLPGVGWVSVSS